jgi:PEGA domain-containing protein
VGQGEHPVLVQLDGYKKFEQKVRVDAGQTVTVQAELKAVGRLRILSTPAQATVMINGLPAGKTPLDTEVEVGETVVRLEQPGFQAFEQTLMIEGGKTETLSRELAVAGPSEAEMFAEQRALSSFGARVLPRGRSTVDVDIGYPYFSTARITVGAGRIPNLFGFDASVGVRTMLARSEIGLGGRMTVVDNEPFSAAAFTNLWWGSKLLDDSKRNGVTWDVGGMVSLTALTHVTITGRAYAEIWSDRHCPSIDTSTPNHFDGTDPIKVCTDFLGTAANNFNPTASDPEKARIKKLIGSDSTGAGASIFDRENGARFLLSIAGEIAFDQQWNIYFILEGAPFQQSERALFTSVFSAPMGDTDYRIYARSGLTYKF